MLQILFRWGSATDPAGGAHDAPRLPDGEADTGGYLLPIPYHLNLDAFGASSRISFSESWQPYERTGGTNKQSG